MSAPVCLHDLVAHIEPGDQRVAILQGGITLAYGELRVRIDRMAARLHNVGLVRGDRVGILLPKSIAECIAIFAVSRADGVFVPINPLLKSGQVRHVLSDCGARVLITNMALLAEHGPTLETLEDLSTVLVVDGTDSACSGPLMVWSAEIDAAASPRVRAIGEDLAAILYTSGSTGYPKGVMLSHRNLIAGCRIVRTYLDIGPNDRILSVLPFSFDYGLNQLITTVEQRAMLVLLCFSFGDEIVRALAEHKITGLAGVPTIWAILTRAAPSLRKASLPHLRYITNSGGAVPTEIIRRLRDLLPGTRIFLMYGLTEAFRSTYLPPEEIDRRPNSIGRAVPECEVFVVTGDGRRAAPGELGILAHRGPTVSLGYWRRPDETAKVLRPNPFRPPAEGGEIVCYSGDLVVEDEDGFFTFVGRNDTMIKSSGYRISPTEVEEVLMALGIFQQVAVIGLPDPYAGQKVHAVVVPLVSAVDTKAVLTSAAGQLPTYMVPRAIETVERLPITPNGKVDYKTLVMERSGS